MITPRVPHFGVNDIVLVNADKPCGLPMQVIKVTTYEESASNDEGFPAIYETRFSYQITARDLIRSGVRCVPEKELELLRKRTS